MVEVTEAATAQIAEYFKGKEPSPVRIFLNEGGWGGPSLALALDELKDTDTVFDVEGFQYIADKDFIEKATPVKIDFSEYGFKLTSGLDLGAGGGCSGCGTSGEACS